MIIKNGEILAIDHIAHDNTLSGNGTSAKPVGLSQSTKDLIDSKVKKTDFETYKSSAANQISNINTKITTDESNFESYKSSAHNEIARIDGSIAAVNAAKVDKTTFTQYQTDVANNFTAVNKRIDDVDAAKVSNTTFEQYQTAVANDFTAANKRIDDVSAAKQDKGYYVSASDFNSYKSSAHNEIARVDGRINATNTNLENNYYDITETYNKTEVDKKFADFGGYKFRAADPENNNQPILNDGEEADPKAIYLTQPAGATQYLQWVCDEEHIDPPLWKCIGDTTMDLKDYAKTVDVVASAEANKDWAERTFETQTEFSAVIKGYYTKDEVNTELATKVDNDNFNAYKTEADGKFATKQNLTDTKAELESTIESVSGEIISKVNTDYGTLDGKIDAIANTLSNDYYTSLEIDAILAASGEYYTKTESDTKYTEKSVFETAINELSSNKLDKSATANWDVTEYTEGENIKIVNHEISGKDWSDEIAVAVENKVDESELENYYTSDQIDDKFVTKTEFNDLDNEVGAIDADLNILSGKTVTVIKDSETVKAIRSTEPDGTISYTLSAHDGKQADYLWKPTVNAAGDISWELALTGDTPDPANIKGPQGISGTPGKNGENGITPHIGNNNHWFIGDDDTGVSATGPQGEDGDKGEPGFSPTVAAVAITDGEKTGTEITFTYKDEQGQTQTTVYSAWNGVNGEGATVHFNGVDGIEISAVDTTHFNVGLSAAYKKQVEDVSGKQDALTQAQLDYIDAVPVLSAASASWNDKLNASTFNTYTATTAPATFQPKGNYAAKTDLQYVSAGVDYVSGHIPTKVTDLTDSTDYAKKTDLDGFVTKDGITTQGADYVMTTTGWKVLSLPGGGMTQVIHDTTLTGQGNADNDKLGVAWSALSGNTIASALSAGSATVAANLGTSSFADITGAINAKADATAISDMLTKTVAEQTYQTIAGMNSYLTTENAEQTYLRLTQYASDSATFLVADSITGKVNITDFDTYKTSAHNEFVNTSSWANTAFQPKGNYVATADLLTADSNKLTGIKVGNTNYTIQETNWTTTIQTASAKAYNDATANANELYVTKTSAHNEFVNYVATADLLTAASNKLTGIKVGNTNYEIPLFGGVTADNITITGDGNTNPLGVAWSALSGYTITSALSAGSATSAYSAYSASYATTAASAYIDSSTTSAMSEIVNELHGKLDSTAAATTYLPLTGGTVTGQTTISGSAFDTFELKRSDQQGSTGIIGINDAGGMSFKIVNGNNNTQLNIAPNATMDKRFSIGDTPHQPAAYFIPAVTATTTDGLTDDGILHIILES